ncbi:MAG: SUMF1/EgtB/PvdO family nonheme iron enzyme [Bacteroidales bacterium]|nr:SUMF1/EgtB/PvdO family nonheme iron enzyme [Bacteroidales bacterium]
MKESNKTKAYSDSCKTTVYGNNQKRTKSSVHNLKAGDNIILNNKEYKIIEVISESTGEAVIYKIENAEKNILSLKLYFEFHDSENEPNTEALSRIKNIKDIDILRLYDFGTGINKYKGKYCFEISDFAHGHDLLKVENLKEKYKPDFIEKELISQIFKGILRLHENRIYHCDLKPQNVFYLDKEQIEIVIGDYGSAKTFEFDAEKKSRKTTTVKGTDFYLPPEQARGFISEKNDYYSFGMILLHLFYPEKILLNESEPKSLSHSKLKQIIERQFEAKPIIDYNPKYKRINSLIEGLTLVDFNLRWGKEQVEQWIKGEQINVIYKKSTLYSSDAKIQADKRLIFGKHTINTVYDLRDYILNVPNWYNDLIEDKDNRSDFTDWMLNLYDGDKGKRSAFNRIVRHYSQEGVDIVADAIIRFFIPGHPVFFGLKMFDFNESPDLMKTTALAFSHLIFNLLESSSDNDIKLYLFRYEFALRQIEEKQPEVIKLLNILYKNLNTPEEIRLDFINYKVYAYTSGSKKSINNLKQFLLEYLPAKIKIDFVKFNEQNELHYKLEKTLTGYFTEIGINNILIKDNYDETISVNYPEDYKSVEDFYEKTIDVIINSICNKHLIKREMLLETGLDFFEINFINTHNRLSDRLINEYNKLKKSLSLITKRQKSVKNDLKEVELIISEKKYHKTNSALQLILKIQRYDKDRFLIYKQKFQNFISPKKIAIKAFTKKHKLLIIVSLPVIITPIILLLDSLSLNYNESENFVLANIEMIHVKGGTYNMGHKIVTTDEIPLHTVSLNDFYISKYEITNEQFCLFLNSYDSEELKYGLDKGQKIISLSNEEERDWGIHRTDNSWCPKSGYEKHPVIYVTWYGAKEFCEWADSRLPKEAEWEYAARGGNKSKDYSYSGSNKPEDVAWFDSNSKSQTHKVGTKSPNELDIYDMSGNVFEWCEDWYYPKNKPVNLSTPRTKVLRGGSYYSDYNGNLIFYRMGRLPDKCFSNTGFRLCKDNKDP